MPRYSAAPLAGFSAPRANRVSPPPNPPPRDTPTRAVSTVMPPIATSGLRVSSRAARQKFESHHRVGILLAWPSRRSVPRLYSPPKCGSPREIARDCVSKRPPSGRRRKCRARLRRGKSSWPTCTPPAPHMRGDVRAVVDDECARPRERGASAESRRFENLRAAMLACRGTESARRPPRPALPRMRAHAIGGRASRPGSRRALGNNGRLPSISPHIAVERSRKCVSNFPAMKSGSARIRFCSGIVVLMPFDHEAVRAPAACAQSLRRDRGRARSILATSES